MSVKRRFLTKELLERWSHQGPLRWKSYFKRVGFGNALRITPRLIGYDRPLVKQYSVDIKHIHINILAVDRHVKEMML